MYLVRNRKSPNYQLIYLREGRRTSVSTGTKNKQEAEKFKASFITNKKAAFSAAF